ncbi:MAG: hypothetical protein ACI8Y7_000237 [Candidatus Woesearchaeota archaeon]|jgi:hypothetical protein
MDYPQQPAQQPVQEEIQATDEQEEEEDELCIEEIAEGIREELALLNVILLKKFNYDLTDDGEIVDKVTRQ